MTKVRMTNKDFPGGEAHVDKGEVPVWEAAGWAVDPAKNTPDKKETKE